MIMIGGGGERKTLRLVAEYGDACNLFASPDLARKLDVLRAHCDAPAATTTRSSRRATTGSTSERRARRQPR
jgi:hypothetical protein